MGGKSHLFTVQERVQSLIAGVKLVATHHPGHRAVQGI